MSEHDPAAKVEPTVETPTVATEGAKPDEALGDMGKKALESERAARKAAEEERKTLAAKLKEFEDRDKTDQEKADAALAEARAELAALTVAKTRAEVAAAKGVPAELLNGSTQAEFEASADALIAFKGQQSAAPVVPTEGASSGGTRGASQLTADDISKLTPEEINAARRDGRLNRLLGIT